MLKNKIVAIKGIPNSGKSSTIKEVYEKLKTTYGDALKNEISIGGDILVIIIINGVKVGIESQGDPNSRLFNSLNRFNVEKCQFILCATRTRGGTVESVNALSNNYDVEWIDKPKVDEGQIGSANRIMADEIFRKIQNFIRAYNQH